MVADNIGKTECEVVKDGHSEATFADEKLTLGMTADKTPNKEDGVTAEGKDENLGDVRHGAGDTKKPVLENSNGQKDKHKPVEESRKSAVQHVDPTERDLSNIVLEMFCCCCSGLLQCLLK